VGKDDIVAITGGGYLGTLWIYEEERVRHIVQTFKDRPVFIFPQTVYYSSDAYGQKQLEKTQRIYARCKKLVIFAREKKSEALLKGYFPHSKVVLAPDMALFLEGYENDNTREGALLCLRNDKEKVINENLLIESYVTDALGAFSYIDTKHPYEIPFAMRGNELDKLLYEFSKTKLVITDRLHGMVFAALTHTPCVVLPSKSHKVKGVYEWMQYLNYVKLTDDITEIPQAIAEVTSVKNPAFDNKNLMQHFQTMADVITKECGNG
jgi:pyruvyl transferase EpsI